MINKASMQKDEASMLFFFCPFNFKTKMQIAIMHFTIIRPQSSSLHKKKKNYTQYSIKNPSLGFVK